MNTSMVVLTKEEIDDILEGQGISKNDFEKFRQSLANTEENIESTYIANSTGDLIKINVAGEKLEKGNLIEFFISKLDEYLYNPRSLNKLNVNTSSFFSGDESILFENSLSSEDNSTLNSPITSYRDSNGRGSGDWTSIVESESESERGGSLDFSSAFEDAKAALSDLVGSLPETNQIMLDLDGVQSPKVYRQLTLSDSYVAASEGGVQQSTQSLDPLRRKKELSRLSQNPLPVNKDGSIPLVPPRRSSARLKQNPESISPHVAEINSDIDGQLTSEALKITRPSAIDQEQSAHFRKDHDSAGDLIPKPGLNSEEQDRILTSYFSGLDAIDDFGGRKDIDERSYDGDRTIAEGKKTEPLNVKKKGLAPTQNIDGPLLDHLLQENSGPAPKLSEKSPARKARGAAKVTTKDLNDPTDVPPIISGDRPIPPALPPRNLKRAEKQQSPSSSNENTSLGAAETHEPLVAKSFILPGKQTQEDISDDQMYVNWESTEFDNEFGAKVFNPRTSPSRPRALHRQTLLLTRDEHSLTVPKYVPLDQSNAKWALYAKKVNKELKNLAEAVLKAESREKSDQKIEIAKARFYDGVAEIGREVSRLEQPPAAHGMRYKLSEIQYKAKHKLKEVFFSQKLGRSRETAFAAQTPKPIQCDDGTFERILANPLPMARMIEMQQYALDTYQLKRYADQLVIESGRGMSKDKSTGKYPMCDGADVIHAPPIPGSQIKGKIFYTHPETKNTYVIMGPVGRTRRGTVQALNEGFQKTYEIHPEINKEINVKTKTKAQLDSIADAFVNVSRRKFSSK